MKLQVKCVYVGLAHTQAHVGEGVHVLYLWFGKSPVSVKFWSRWPPVKMVLPSLLSLYLEMSPLGWDGWSQYSSTADVFIIRCLGLNQIPGDRDAKYNKKQLNDMKRIGQADQNTSK